MRVDEELWMMDALGRQKEVLVVINKCLATINVNQLIHKEVQGQLILICLTIFLLHIHSSACKGKGIL